MAVVAVAAAAVVAMVLPLAVSKTESGTGGCCGEAPTGSVALFALSAVGFGENGGIVCNVVAWTFLAVVFADVFAVAASSDRFLWASANFIFREHNIV